eukprot:CAMPEP_0114486738 /NCGR_PEP_ID=MMETSP0109-20121206/378_1 /TAXON_ID=29199 /ORGANISM="Chlorarachnion reptans, Strain CCCM449" /LENGTH=278 /DNA_ID=CAMNT_0001662927 /DNA_START=190 /DNA_END=1026 /DNA_ORIENTATION=+
MFRNHCVADGTLVGVTFSTRYSTARKTSRLGFEDLRLLDLSEDLSIEADDDSIPWNRAVAAYLCFKTLFNYAQDNGYCLEAAHHTSDDAFATYRFSHPHKKSRVNASDFDNRVKTIDKLESALVNRSFAGITYFLHQWALIDDDVRFSELRQRVLEVTNRVLQRLGADLSKDSGTVPAEKGAAWISAGGKRPEMRIIAVLGERGAVEDGDAQQILRMAKNILRIQGRRVGNHSFVDNDSDLGVDSPYFPKMEEVPRGLYFYSGQMMFALIRVRQFSGR